jgi:hypothetical protein
MYKNNIKNWFRVSIKATKLHRKFQNLLKRSKHLKTTIINARMNYKYCKDVILAMVFTDYISAER